MGTYNIKSRVSIALITAFKFRGFKSSVILRRIILKKPSGYSLMTTTTKCTTSADIVKLAGGFIAVNNRLVRLTHFFRARFLARLPGGAAFASFTEGLFLSVWVLPSLLYACVPWRYRRRSW